MIAVWILALLAAAAAAGAGGAAVSWWLVCRAYDRGLRAGLSNRQREVPERRPQMFRLPRRVTR